MNKIVVFLAHKAEDRVCEYGDKHYIVLCTRKFLYPTGETFLMDNGYEKRQMPLYRDGQGRIWEKHMTIDYSNNISYVCRDTQRRAFPRLPYNGIEIK